MSDDCGIGQYCWDAVYTCEAGCGTDDDCLAGESCDATHTCTPYGCRSTALDCAIGQLCDVATGICSDAPTCEVCTDTAGAECAPGACVDFTVEADGGTYCLTPCAVVDDPEQCPRGLECRDLSGAGDLYCYADCPALLVEIDG